MKKKIIIITTVLLVAGALAFAYDALVLSPGDAAEKAAADSRRIEIDNLLMRISEMSLEESVKQAKITPVNTYYGQITKYVTPLERETSYIVSKMTNDLAVRQTELDILNAAISLYNSELLVEDAKKAYDDALEEYDNARKDASASRTGLLTLEYDVESKRISLKQAQNSMEAARRFLDDITGMEGVIIELPAEYSDPYKIDYYEALESLVENDIGLYKAERDLEAAEKRLEIAGRFYDEEDEEHMRDLAAYETALLNYGKTKAGLEISLHDDIDSLKNKYDSIELEMLNNTIKKESYESALSQLNAGILARTAFESYEHSYEMAKRQVRSKIYDFIAASLKFEIETGYSF